MREIVSKSLADTEHFAEETVYNLETVGSGDGATIVSLYGNLGSGKTTFCQIVGKILGVKETIQSPTFLIQKSYETKHPIFKKFVHIDAYRIDDVKEMKTLRFEETLALKNSLIAIEWPERIEKLIPKTSHKIYFEFVDETTRKFKI